MSGTGIAYADRTSSTDLAHAAAPCPALCLSVAVDDAKGQVAPYAHAMRCPVLTYRMVLPAYARAMPYPVLAQRMMLCYTMSGAEKAHGVPAYARATRCLVLRQVTWLLGAVSRGHGQSEGRIGRRVDSGGALHIPSS
eukprot:2088642-Rhodomonas_salina.6